MNKCELLMPAGNFDKFMIAVNYGADAVYLAGKRYGMRATAGNLSDEELKKAVDIAHSMGKKVFVTVNIFARDEDFDRLDEYILFLQDINVDAVIVADLGIISMIQKVAPKLTIHLSTQANTLNSYAANFYHDMGIKRIVLARELSLNQIENIVKSTPDSLELEMFAHGSMCMAYSGRCAISTYLTGREANQGLCTQPCRWEFSLSESKRDGEVFHVEEEDGEGMYFFNSKDLNMLPHLKDLLDTGINSIKIEGRMKSELYVASVGLAYRKELDRYYLDKENYTPDENNLAHLDKVTYRPYTTGFNYQNPAAGGQSATKSEYIAKWSYIGKVIKVSDDENKVYIKEFNPFSVGDTVESLNTDGTVQEVKILELINEDGESIEISNTPKEVVLATLDKSLGEFTLLRKKVG